MKNMIENKKNKNLLLVLLSIGYLIWFYYLEKRTINYIVIDSVIDQFIPFNEFFIVPYLLWFIYIPIVGIYLYRKSYDLFFDYVIILLIGMLISLAICTIIPNGTDFRPELNNENVFQKIVSYLYRTDTNTNVFPSIHVYNSIVANKFIIKENESKIIKLISFTLCILICLSTVFLKQHSLLDGIASVFLYSIIILKMSFELREEKYIKKFT